MKVQVTALKAPWPEGTKVGDVVELDSVPPWAVGKCTPAPDDAPVTVAQEAEGKPKGKPKG